MKVIGKHNYNISCFHESIYLEKFKAGKRLKNRLHHLEHTFKYTNNNGHILEFGVFQGNTINVIAKHFNKDIVHGFDSFEGLPEDWDLGNKVIKGEAFDRQGVLPDVKDNVRLHKGWFDQTLPIFIKQNKLTNIKLLHVDCDLYSSSIYVLKELNTYIKEGTVIVFDDFYPWGILEYDNWQEGEYKALKEWIEMYDRKFIVLSHNNHQQCAIKVVQ